MDGWMDGMDGWMDGRTDGRMHGWMDGWTDSYKYLCRMHACVHPSVNSLTLSPESRDGHVGTRFLSSSTTGPQKIQTF